LYAAIGTITAKLFSGVQPGTLNDWVEAPPPLAKVTRVDSTTFIVNEAGPSN
jgi:hypothetical protein